MEPKVVTPGICFKEKYCPDSQVESNNNCFCVALIVPLLDHLMSDLEIRFPQNELTAYWRLHIIPYIIFVILNSWNKELHASAKFYYEGLPSINCFDSELDLWLAHW